MRCRFEFGILLQAFAIVWLASLAQAGGSERLSSEILLPAHLPASAIGQDVFEGEQAHLEARLLISSGPEPQAGVLFSPAPGWHIYWRNPGDTGLAPKLGLEASGYRVGAVRWPAPQVFDEADGLFTTYGYSEPVLLSVPLIADRNAAPKSDAYTNPPGGEIRAHSKVLVCETECVPAEFLLSSPIAAGLTPEDQARVDRLFAEARSRTPLAMDDLGLDATAHWAAPSRPSEDRSARLILRIDPCAVSQGNCKAAVSGDTSTPFLAFEDQAFEFSNVRVSKEKGSTASLVEMQALRLDGDDDPDRLRGLVRLDDGHGRLMHVAIDLPIESARLDRAMPAAPVIPAAPSSSAGFLEVMLLALLGGLILNGMPCVLPVLAIKIVAIADLAEKHPRDIRMQGLAYTGGVLASMAILAAIVISLRSAGQSVGWGFQFQEPLFVASISAILVAFALNLFGVFEIDLGQGRLAQVGQKGSEVRRSVFEGLLAVVLATPCSAPFLGTAVGFAFAASSLSILMIFLVIGLGLALPFLAVSFVPGFARFIPHSGPWMIQLRAGLGFSLLATVVWLLWIVGQSGGTDVVIEWVGMLLLLAFLLWGIGQAQPMRSPWLARAAAITTVGIAFAGFNLIEFESAQAGKVPDAAPMETGWTVYSETAVAAALAEGRTAFVVFTADWCITCKVNEKMVIERPAIREAFASGHVALFRADWTHRDETIRAKLAEFGRAGVPLYLVYSPDRPPDRPEVLSELLSQDEVRLALARANAPDRS